MARTSSNPALGSLASLASPRPLRLPTLADVQHLTSLAETNDVCTTSGVVVAESSPLPDVFEPELSESSICLFTSIEYGRRARFVDIPPRCPTQTLSNWGYILDDAMEEDSVYHFTFQHPTRLNSPNSSSRWTDSPPASLLYEPVPSSPPLSNIPLSQPADIWMTGSQSPIFLTPLSLPNSALSSSSESHPEHASTDEFDCINALGLDLENRIPSDEELEDEFSWIIDDE